MPTATLTCDNCDKPFSVDDVNIGDKVKCPICADVSVVRSLSSRAEEDRAAAAGLPAKHGPEVDVRRLRPAMFRAQPLKFLLLSLGTLGGITGAIVASMAAMLPVAAIAAVVAVACVVMFGIWKFQTMHDGLLLTTRRIVDREGLFSKNTSEILLRDIRHVVVKQTFSQRLMGIGTLALSSAADDGVEIYMEHLADPDEVKRIIDLYR